MGICGYEIATNTEVGIGMEPELKISQLSRIKHFYPAAQAEHLLTSLLEDVPWQSDYCAFGRRISIPRAQAWYADAGIKSHYSSNMLVHHNWTPLLLSAKQKIEQQTGHDFNSVLLTCYRNGDDHVTFHADDEPELGESPVIASLSVGVRRTFEYRRKQTKEIFDIQLNAGDLLVMEKCFQRDWLHCAPVEPGLSQPRINLTFRRVMTSL